MENVLIPPYTILLKTALVAEFTETKKKELLSFENLVHFRIS